MSIWMSTGMSTWLSFHPKNLRNSVFWGWPSPDETCPGYCKQIQCCPRGSSILSLSGCWLWCSLESKFDSKSSHGDTATTKDHPNLILCGWYHPWCARYQIHWPPSSSSAIGTVIVASHWARKSANSCSLLPSPILFDAEILCSAKRVWQ